MLVFLTDLEKSTKISNEAVGTSEGSDDKGGTDTKSQQEAAQANEPTGVTGPDKTVGGEKKTGSPVKPKKTPTIKDIKVELIRKLFAALQFLVFVWILVI